MQIKAKILLLLSSLFLFTLIAYAVLFYISLQFKILLGLGILAYTLGLRHGFDADHIIAIDNTTRKLIHDGKKPVANGFFFSLGHSTVVMIMVLLIVIAAKSIFSFLYNSRTIFDIVGTIVSASFLYIIAMLNLAILLQTLRKPSENDTLPKSIFASLFSKLFSSIHSSWQLYPIGFLFGIGFDTASEITLLGISATQAAAAIPTIYILILPVLFAAGMTLVDSTNSVFIMRAYSWALLDKAKRISYNVWITAVSIFIALAVATMELLSII